MMGQSIPLTEATRDELVKCRREGESWRQLARHFGVSASTIGRWLVRDDVDCFVTFNADTWIMEPICQFYKGFAVSDYAKLSRFVEIGMCRLKVGEQVRIKDFDIDKNTAISERVHSWAARRPWEVSQHPLYRGGCALD